jgi:hypothetical protein
MNNISKIVKSKISQDLLTTADVADILKVSRERVRQLIVQKILPPKYIFNQNLKRKQYIFDKVVIENYIKNKFVKWEDSENTNFLTIVELKNILECSSRWIYNMTRRGKLIPAIVAGYNNNLICLYDLVDVQRLWLNKTKKGSRKGYRKNTVMLLQQIKTLYTEGLNDCEIAEKLNKKQPFIAKLRKEIGLVSLYKKGRPRNNSIKPIEQNNMECYAGYVD